MMMYQKIFHSHRLLVGAGMMYLKTRKVTVQLKRKKHKKTPNVTVQLKRKKHKKNLIVQLKNLKVTVKLKRKKLKVK